MAAANEVGENRPGALTLAHVEAWERELETAGLLEEAPAPVLLPDYRRR